MKARFIATGLSYGVGKIKIPNTGYETDDPQIIEFLRSSQGYGNFFHEVASSDELHDAEVAHAKKLLAKEGLLPPQEVAPVKLPDMEEEQEALKAEEESKAQDAAELAAIKEEKAAKNAAYQARAAKKASK